MKRGLGAVIGALVAAFVCATSASADTWCVPSGGPPACTHASADLQTALNAASAQSGADTVKLLPGAYEPTDCTTAGFSYSGATGNALTLTGAGSGQTVLTCPDNYNNAPNHFTPVLTLSGPATVSDLQINLPTGQHDRGLNLTGGASADHVDVTTNPSASASVIAVRMTGGSFRSGLIGTPLSDNGEGVLANGGAALSDVSITSGGIGLTSAGTPDVTLARAEITAPQGVVAAGGGVQLSDVAIDVVHGAGPTPLGGLVLQAGSSGPFSIGARNVSISGNAAGSYGVYIAASVGGATAAVTLTDSAIHGPPLPLLRSAVSRRYGQPDARLRRLPCGRLRGLGAGRNDGPHATGHRGSRL